MFEKSKTILKTVNILFLISLGTFFIKPNIALAGGSLNTCTAFTLFNRSPDKIDLHAWCKNNNGESFKTVLTISDYIANYGGRLSWAKPVGNFQKSCRNITFTSAVGLIPRNVLWLKAECPDGKGGWNSTGLDIDPKLSNQNGVLAVDR